MAQPQNEPTTATGDLHSPKRRVPTCNADRSMPMATFDADGTSWPMERGVRTSRETQTRVDARKLRERQRVAEIIFLFYVMRFFGPKRRILSYYRCTFEITVATRCNS